MLYVGGNLKTSKSLLKRLVNNHLGFSITEVLIASGMLGIVALGMMKMTETSNKSSKKLRVDFNISNLMEELFVVKKDPAACENTINRTNAGANNDLRGLPGNLTGTPESRISIDIRDGLNNSLLIAGMPSSEYGIGSGGTVTVDSIEIVGSTPPINNVGVATAYSLIIEIGFTKNGVDGPSATFTKSFTIDVVDNNGDGIINFGVDSCSTTSSQTSIICNALGGVTVQDSIGRVRCANIDLFNNEGDGTTPGESRYFGVMARGGLALVEDTAGDGTGAVDKYWSILPTPTRLKFRIDDSNNPDGANYPNLSLVSTNTGTSTEFRTNADTHIFNDTDGSTQRMRIHSSGRVMVGTASTPPAQLTINANDKTTEDGLRITTNVSNADILMAGNGAIAADNNLFINIDSNNDETDRKFHFGKDAKGSTATYLMTIQEDGAVGIGTDSPSSKLEVLSQQSAGNGVMIRTSSASSNSIFRLMNGDSDWALSAQGGSDDDFWVYNETNSTRAIQIDKSTNGVVFGHSTNSASGALDLYNGHLYLYRTSDEIGRPTTVDCQVGTAGNQNCRVVHKAWVYRAIAGGLADQMTAGQRQNVMEHLLQTVTTGNWGALKTDLLNDVNSAYDAALTGGGVCPSGQFVERVRYDTDGRIRFDCSNPLGCGTRGNCANVYAGTTGAGRVCIRNGGGDFDCISHGQNTWPSSCLTVDSVQVGYTAARYTNCPGNRMIRAVQILSGGRIRITCCANEVTVDE